MRIEKEKQNYYNVVVRCIGEFLPSGGSSQYIEGFLSHFGTPWLYIRSEMEEAMLDPWNSSAYHIGSMHARSFEYANQDLIVE